MPILNLENKDELARYNKFVENAKFTSITQDLAWGKVKNNWESLAVYLEENEQIIAAMSILLIKNVGEQRFAYVPKGPVFNEQNVDLLQRLVQEVEAELIARHVFLLRCDPEWDYDQKLNQKLQQAHFIVRNRDFSGHNFIQPRFNMVVPLKATVEEELANLSKKTRYNIKWAIKNGAKTSLSDHKNDLLLFYKLYSETSQRHQITYRPYEYFERLADNFLKRGIMKIATVYFQGALQAASLLFKYGQKVWYMYAGSTEDHPKLMSSYLLNWVGINWAIENHLSEYDLGGVFALDASDSLYVFKNKFVKPNLPREYIGEIDRIYDQGAYDIYLHGN